METNFAKPTAVSDEAHRTVYCISCEKMVEVGTLIGNPVHTNTIYTDEGVVIEICDFPGGIAYSAPDNDLPDDWAEQEPDDDQKAELELAEIGEWLGME